MNTGFKMSSNAVLLKKKKYQNVEPAKSLDLVIDCPILMPLDLIDLTIFEKSDFYQDIRAYIIPLCKESRFEKAINVLLGYLKKYSNDPYVLNFLGALYLHIEKPIEAELYLNRAVSYAPKDFRLLNNRACVYILKNDPLKALNLFNLGLKDQLPNSPEYYYNMALAHHRLGDRKQVKSFLALADGYGTLKESLLLGILLDSNILSIAQMVDRLEKILKLYPTSLLINYYYTLYLFFLKDIDRSIYFSARLVNLDPAWIYGRILFMTIVQHVNFPDFRKEVCQAILSCLCHPGGNISYLANLWRNQMSSLSFFEKTLSEKIEDLDLVMAHFMNALNKSDDLTFNFLCRGLERLVPKSALLELILIGIRKIFLTRIANDQISLTSRESFFLTALAHQSFLNEYVYFVDDDEKKQCDDIKNKAQNRCLHRYEALILMCYEPISSLLGTYILDPEDQEIFKSFMQSQVIDQEREALLEKRIPSVTAIYDDTSKKVEKMYMENPYPRWISVNFSGKQDYLNLSDRRSSRGEILVAGCGTGQHALYVALRYKNCHVTALDLSRRSLAYAKRKTEEMGITHIDYVQGDILELGPWNRQFDMIESAGVLHHLADPLKGLDILLGLLKPGGVMMLGLYSEFARAPIVVARHDIAARGIMAVPNQIRAYRHDVLTNDSHPAKALCGRADFYTMSTCRDLIFHVQETRYTLEELSRILAERNLVFSGFNIDQVILDRFHKEYPGEESLLDLNLWHSYEQKYPETFQGMYQFFCKKHI